MKRYFYTGMLILFLSCFFTGQLVAADEEDFPWEIFIPVITSAGRNAKAPCSPENCTKDQWDDIFVRAITELDAEGLVITPETIRTDIVVYWAVFDRIRSIVGLKEAEGQKLNATFAPKEVEGQKLNAAFAPYDNEIIYCGPGNSKTNPEPFKNKDPKTFEKCINTACFNHDNCYDTIDNLSNECYWDKTTKDCDDAFFSAKEICESLNECGPDCKNVETIARMVTDVDCVNDILVSWTEWCKKRLACPDCTPKSVKDSCDAIGAQCGPSKNVCGGTIDCGSCIDPSTPECGTLNGMYNQCMPKCSIREGTCTMSEQSSGLTLTYWLQSPPPWGGAPIPYCEDDYGNLLTGVPGGLKTAEIIRNNRDVLPVH